MRWLVTAATAIAIGMSGLALLISFFNTERLDFLASVDESLRAVYDGHVVLHRGLAEEYAATACPIPLELMVGQVWFVREPETHGKKGELSRWEVLRRTTQTITLQWMTTDGPSTERSTFELQEMGKYGWCFVERDESQDSKLRSWDTAPALPRPTDS